MREKKSDCLLWLKFKLEIDFYKVNSDLILISQSVIVGNDLKGYAKSREALYFSVDNTCDIERPGHCRNVF